MATLEPITPPVDPSDDPLWHGIDAVDFDELGTPYSFARRLADENGWTPNYAARVIDEYKRFCYLAVRAGHAVVPSDAIDQVWHLHLAFSDHYWRVFCGEVLGMDLHHCPANGGDPEDAADHRESYAETIRSYVRLSGELPPTDIWPDTETQFGPGVAMRRVNPADYLIIRRPPKGLLWALQVALIFAILYFLYQANFTMAIVLGIATVGLALYRDRTDNRWKIKPWRDGDDGGVGTGGCSSRGI